MKQTKRLILLAISAVLVLAVVSPAVASAHMEWQYEGKPIPEEEEEPGWRYASYKATLWVAKYSSANLEVKCEYSGIAMVQGGKLAHVSLYPAELYPAQPVVGERCVNPWGGNKNCLGKPTSTALAAYPKASGGWALSEEYRLSSNMELVEGEGKPCFDNDHAQFSSNFEPVESRLTNPIRLTGLVVARTLSHEGQGYITGATLEYKIEGAELVEVP
jgi:hypothetical protein